jgi:hypothetical protein
MSRRFSDDDLQGGTYVPFDEMSSERAAIPAA